MSEAQRAAARERWQRWRSEHPDYVDKQNERERERRRAKRAAMSSEERERERERQREVKRRWRAEHPDLVSERNRDWYAANQEQAKAAMRERGRRQRADDRQAVFDHYGWACACCDSTDRPTIDHVNGDGQQHRAEIFGRQKAGDRMYRWLVLNGFPPGFQTLCLRCNRSKGSGKNCQLNHAA